MNILKKEQYVYEKLVNSLLATCHVDSMNLHTEYAKHILTKKSLEIAQLDYQSERLINEGVMQLKETFTRKENIA